ncbi:CMP/dCMP deaminase zinc-binding protein [Calditerrivibrio nitroreducens DSM 19672]|uniref:tRNA-specific adenosine deaminase n=2 Tax=Calditerrivibrio nitroreducens TaxID=477976 RepID=E4TJ29_CALNY|nr:CMP/dCMP deaminase zinc-binding protein [Calditerrivibrio nitroreducens DSM 19672]
MDDIDLLFMKKTIQVAKRALKYDDVPIGAIVVMDGKIIASGYNRKKTTKNPLDHAEIIAMKKAARKIGDWRLNNCVLYSTLEPCIMCAGAILHYRIKRVVFGTLEPKFGGVVSNDRIFDIKTLNHRVEYEFGFFEEEIKGMMRDFFKKVRGKMC